MISIQGKIAILRDWEVADFAPYQYWHQGEHEWMKYNGPYYPQKTEQEIKNSIQAIKKQLKTNDFPTIRPRLVIADSETNTLIGTVNWYWQSKETNWISIGIAIYDDKYWGKGIGFDALHIWCH